MNTDKPAGSDMPSESRGGPSPFTEEELRAATAPPPGEPELDEVDPADIDERGADFEPFHKLIERSARLAPERVRNVLQAILFVADKPLTLDQLFESTGIDRAVIERGLGELAEIHREGAAGIVLYEVATGWQLRTEPQSADYVRRFLHVKPQRLTRAAVETLAIIAYRQPVTRPEVEDIRGVDCGAVIKALLDRRLIKILGKKEDVGRPILYGTTDEFLEFFALKDLAALPTLREFQELTQEHQEIVEKEVGPAVPSAAGTVEALRDEGFEKKLDESTAASEAALVELEAAIDTADVHARKTAETLNPPPPPVPPVSAGDVTNAVTPEAPVAQTDGEDSKGKPST